MLTRDRIRQFLALVLPIAQAVTNIVLGSQVFTEESDQIIRATGTPDSLFTPADYAFAVWGPIFLGMIAYGVYQALPAQRERPLHRRIGWWSIANSVATTLWAVVVFAAGQPGTPEARPEFVVVSAVLIVVMLICLTNIFVALRQMDSDLTVRDRWLVQVPISIFFAWICVATVANWSSALIAIGLDAGEAAALWTVVMIAAATLITSGVILYSRANIGTAAYLSVVVWALVGLYVATRTESQAASTASLIAAGIVLLVAAYRFLNNRPRRGQSPRRMTATA
ncbi:MAG: hypothetical protein SF029_08865 [bacterium]|nr:hypothetical protein [bacterium]